MWQDLLIHWGGPVVLAGLTGVVAVVRTQNAAIEETKVDLREARARLDLHEALDSVRFTHVTETLVDIRNTGKSTDEKVDRLVEKLIPQTR